MTRKLILGGNPDEIYPVPAKGDFEVQGDWIHASGAEKIGQQLIQECKSLNSLDGANISYLFKKSGGSRNGKAILGMCTRPSGLLRFFSGMHFVIWFGADNLRDRAINRWQMEALIFHELKHAEMDGQGEGETPVIRPHDFEGFGEEITRYGFWRRDAELIGKAVAQTLKLPFPETLPGILS